MAEYLSTQEMLDHLEVQSPLLTAVNAIALSQAISLKRIADALCQPDEYGLTGSAAIAQAIKIGLRERQ
jgi:hypothetical protein